MSDIHVAAPHISDEARRLVGEVLDSGRLAQGPMVERFEAQCAAMAGTTHAIAVSSGTDALEVAVTDTGIGIEAVDQETIFDEFRQAGGDYTNKQEGTGLGLSLTRRIVELHGGTISVESTPGEGATFTFTLPRQA